MHGATSCPATPIVALGSKAHRAASEFTDMDERNAARLRTVRCNSST
ncbi:DUF2563 family protein [Mycobacterium rhizamassiliense]